MTNRELTVFTTDCPKCKVLKKKLTEKNILFKECHDIEEMKKYNIQVVPVLKIDEIIPNEEFPVTTLLNFSDAVKWVNNYKESE